MNSFWDKYSSISRIIAVSMLIMSGLPALCAENRLVIVSLDDKADETMSITIGHGVVMRKKQIYKMQISDTASFNVFNGQCGRSLSCPIDSSTTSIVVIPTHDHLGLGIKVEQKSYFSPLYSLVAWALSLPKH